MKFEIYEDADQQFRYRLKADNQQIIAVSGEGYTTQRSALKAVRLLATVTGDTLVTIHPLDERRRSHTKVSLITETGTLD